MEARLLKLSGNEATFALSEEVNFNEISKKKNGAVVADIDWQDGRMISHNQRKFIFALVSDISGYTGYTTDYVIALLKTYHSLIIGADTFSLANGNCSMEQASKFIETVIQFCFDNEIPFMHQEWHKDPSYHRVMFMYLINRKCMVTGKPNADICHVETVGMGRDRKTIDHMKHSFISLSREYHILQHTIGITEFMNKFHLIPIKLKKEHLDKLGL